MIAAIRRRYLQTNGENFWVLPAGLIASLQSISLSAVALKRLDIAEFGLFSLCISTVLFVGAMVRASIAETGLGEGAFRTVPRLSVLLAWAIGLFLGALAIAPQLALAVTSFDLLLPTSIACAGVAAGEVSRVRLIAEGLSLRLFVAELLRLLFLVLAVVVFAGDVGTFLIVAGLTPAVTTAAAILQRGRVADWEPSIALRLVAALDIFVQRAAGQISTVLVFSAASASVVGTISAARLGFAPLTTLYTASAGLVLTGSSFRAARLRSILRMVISAGALYSVAFFLLIRRTAAGELIFGDAASSVSGVLLPISLFVISGSMSPIVSTALRRIGRPQLSLRARLVASGGLLSAVALVLYGFVLRDGAAVAWAYALGGSIGAIAWWTTFRNLATSIALKIEGES